MIFSDLGKVAFADALALQERLAAEIAQGGEETVLFAEHPPVYTSGRGGYAGNILDGETVPVITNRGGDVTWHGPGQLVCYPLLDLGRRGRDLHRYLRFLEETVIGALALFGIRGFRRGGRTGVWTERGKIASIGVGVRRWVTMHGFALNVCPDLKAFRKINPCGIAGCPMTSMLEEGSLAALAEVRAETERVFRELFPLRLGKDEDP